MPTASGYKNRILDYAADNGHDISGARAMKLAIQLHRRQARMQDLDLERIINYSDPTGETATSNVMAKNNGPGTVTKQFSEAVQPALRKADHYDSLYQR